MTTSAPTRSVEIRHVEVWGQRVRVAIWPGDRSRTPLLLLNGISGRIELLTPLAESLGEIETLTFEVPGAGESTTPRLPYTLPLMAAFTARLLTKLGYDKVDVFGVSWGGTLAQQFALQYGHRCRRLILAATMAGIPTVPGRLHTVLKLSTPRRFNDPAYRSRIAGEIYGGKARTDRAVISDLHRRYGKTSGRGYLFQQLAVTGWSSQALLPVLSQPTLVLAGADDPLIPLVNMRWIAKLIPHSTLHVFDDGHLFFLSSLDETRQVITSFLTGDTGS